MRCSETVGGFLKTRITGAGTYKGNNQRRGISFERTAFRLKQGRDEERMIFQLHRANFARLIVGRCAKRACD